MNYITNGMPAEARLPVAVVERMERYLSATTALFDGGRAYTDWLPDERRTFAVYMLWANDDASLDTYAVEACESRRSGPFRTWAEARQELADIVGWPRALSESEQSELNGEMQHLFTLGEDAIRARLHQLFVIVELDDGTVYVFE